MSAIRWSLICAVLLTLLLISTGEASAADTRSGDQITIASGEVVEGDLYVFGRTVEIVGNVSGDVIGTVESIVVRGDVGGSLNVAGRTIQINGSVARSARVTGDELIVRGAIGGDLVSAVNSLTVTSAGSVQGDLILASGDVSLSGAVAGNITGSASKLNLGGAVAGDVSVSADEINVTNRGRLAGDLRYASNNEVELLGQGEVAGVVERTGNLRALGGPDLFTTATSQIVRLLFGLVAGLVLVSLFPSAVARAADQIRLEFPIAVITGVIGLLIWIALAALLLLIVVGIPVALLGTLLLIVLAWLSQVFVGMAVGRLVLPDGWQVSSRGYNILAMALGMVLIGAVRSLPFPYISSVVAILSIVLALGAVIMTLKPDRERAW